MKIVVVGLVALFTALTSLFVFLQIFGGLVGGIWLAVIGEWGTIGFYFLVLALATPVLGIALMPSLFLGGVGAVFANKHSRLGYLTLGFLSSLYVAALMTVWCVGILVVFMNRAGQESWIPTLLLSYGAATGPWAFMASKEIRSDGSGGDMAALAAISAQGAYILIVFVGLVAAATLQTLAITFAVVMLGVVAIQMAAAILSMGEIVATRN